MSCLFATTENSLEIICNVTQKDFRDTCASMISYESYIYISVKIGLSLSTWGWKNMSIYLFQI